MSQSIARVIATLLLLINITSFAAIGKVTQQTGPMEIVRNKQQLESKINSPIEMLDTITTAKTKAEVTFEDHTTVKMTEQSKLIIDDFVYDPKQGSGKLAIKVALGTARYASGQIAKNNPQSVNIQTPTASIAVRGTDFSMVVDELGRSMIMLLPSCDKKSCVTGAIEVSTDAGTVFMDVAYQTTQVNSRTLPPSKPVIVSIDQSNINNMLIITPPKELATDQDIANSKSALDINFLDQDLLKYNALEEDQLASFKELDMNLLDVNLLVNLLDVSNSQLAASQEVLSVQVTLLPGYSEASGLKYYFNDDESKVILNKTSTHTAIVTADVDSDKTVNITQDGVAISQRINKGASSTINIIQK